MFGKNGRLLLVVIVTVGLAVLEFFVFKGIELVGFQVHNIIGLIAGTIIFLSTYELRDRGVGNKYVNFTSLVIGFAMIVIHVTKLLIGPALV